MAKKEKKTAKAKAKNEKALEAVEAEKKDTPALPEASEQSK